jgi:hypothetical protein
MKKLLLTSVSLLFAVLVCKVNAQHQSLSSASNDFKYDATGNAANVADVNTKALRDFSKSFKNVTGEKWYTVSDGFFASFGDNGIETKVAYDKKGTWHCTVRTLEDAQLPSEIRDIVKSKYYDSKILVGYEIKHSEGIVYIIKTQDEKSLKTLRVVNGEMEIVSDYTRG